MQEFEKRASKAEKEELLKSKTEFDILLRTAQKLRDDDCLSVPQENTSYQRAWIKVKASYSRFADTSFRVSKHLDALLLPAPSYVRAAWGAVHLLLMVQVNDQKMKDSTAEVLLRVSQKFELLETLTAYNPNRKMITGLAAVYAAYIQLLQHAIRYYAESRLKRAASSILNPWEARFQPHVDRIDYAIQHILQIGQVSTTGFVRRMCQELKSVKAELERLAPFLHVSLSHNQDHQQMLIVLKQLLADRLEDL